MRSNWVSRQLGAATLESVVVFPILFMLIMTAFGLGYYVYVKLVLTWHVHQQTERLAQATTITTFFYDGMELIKGDQTPAGISGSHGHTFGVPLPTKPFAFSVACYRIPLKLPRFSFGSSAPTTTRSRSESFLSGLRTQIQRVRSGVGAAKNMVSHGDDLADQAVFLKHMANAASDPERRPQAIRMFGGWIAEEYAKSECGGDGLIITAKAVVWSEQTRVLN